jgi:hypothetical protein
MGPEAIRRAVVILAAGEIGKPRGEALEPGAQWGGDRMLLSVGSGSVQFVAGNLLYAQNHIGFLLAEFPPGSASPRRPSWLMGLPAHEAPCFLALAAELAQFWPGTGTACGFLERYGHFYRLHRPPIVRAASELRSMAEALLALQRWPEIFEVVADAMGRAVEESLPKDFTDAQMGTFLGRLMMGAQAGRVTLARLPACLRAIREAPAPQAAECLRIPHYRRMIEKLERVSESAAGLIEQLRTES